MEQIIKLYKFYFKRIFKKNWLRITIVSLLITLTFWFGIPYTIFKMGNISRQFSSNEDGKPFDYKEFSRVLFGNGKKLVSGSEMDKEFKVNREELKSLIKQLEEAKKAGKDEEFLEKVKSNKEERILGITEREAIDRGGAFGIDFLFMNADNVFFFCRTEGYEKGEAFWKLLNDISWWNLNGAVISFWLIFKVLDSIFSQPQQDGEEVMVLSFTPGVKRSDILISKILSFLTFYSIINLLVFILPYGFYYFWVAKATSFTAFSLLTFYSTIIGPILYFGLILVPYLVINDWIKIGFSLFSFLIAFFPIVWSFGKNWFWKLSTWPYTVEEKFFSPAIFTITSLSIGIIFLSLYYLRYQEKDLGN